MLVLTRKMNESIIIDGGIEVMVVAVHGNKVRLGFRAPADVAIQRSECATDGAERRSHTGTLNSPRRRSRDIRNLRKSQVPPRFSAAF